MIYTRHAAHTDIVIKDSFWRLFIWQAYHIVVLWGYEQNRCNTYYLPWSD